MPTVLPKPFFPIIIQFFFFTEYNSANIASKIEIKRISVAKFADFFYSKQKKEKEIIKRRMQK